jgi:XapX domain-containing protein
MLGYLVSLLMGLAVGAAYGLVQVRSPAPPMIALVGLRHGARAAGRRHGVAPFRATGSDLHPSTMWAAPRAVLTRSPQRHVPW